MPLKLPALRLLPALLAPFLALALVTGPLALPRALPHAVAAVGGEVTVRVPEPMKTERRVVIARPEWVAPVRGYRLTGRFGAVSGLWASSHTGLDLAAPSGTPIQAITDGVVAETGYAGAYGLHTVVRLEDGTEHWYSHQSTTRVSRGDRVRAGQVIGAVGTTGNVTGPHLHLEVRPAKGAPVDPLGALARHGLRL